MCIKSTAAPDQILQTPLRVCSAASVRDMWIYLDSDASMTTQIRSILRSVTRKALLSLITALVLSKLTTATPHSPAYLTARWIRCNHWRTSPLSGYFREEARCRLSAAAMTRPTVVRVPQRIEFKLAVLVYHSLHGMAPSYLADKFHRVDDLDSRRRLRSTSTSTLVVPSTRRTTIGDRAFPAVAARVWNSLPSSVKYASLLKVFRRDLKSSLFNRSFSAV